ncbi:MAG: ABC transporter permease [Acidobacteria bacterium]|nr:ABC transporter permease [Acidobacteriota bacterium]
MVAARDNLVQSVSALRAHKLRTVLTVLGLMMGVTTLITVMTLVEGANVYVEQKIANLGTNVFQIARTPFAVTDFTVIIKALKNKRFDLDDWRAVREKCAKCQLVGASASASASVRHGDHELTDVALIGHTANMAEIDTRAIALGRYFTEFEDRHSANVVIVGDSLREQFFPAVDPLGKTIRIGQDEFQVVGVVEKIGSVLGRDADNFVIVPLNQFLRMRGARFSLTLNIRAPAGSASFQDAQDQARMILRARRNLRPGQDEPFFVGTKESYISLWQSISGAFFAVFVMVSSISAVVGGVVIMNVMLVSVTERTKEIGVRRAVGATRSDILRQFLAESVLQCVAGGLVGIGAGFFCAVALRTWTSFPAAVQTWVALLGVFLSSAIGLFFGIYPAVRASRLDPVVALRTE